ncbi:MAG TPA: hypothetical protein VGN12_15065 [Pirellulales bacterium]
MKIPDPLVAGTLRIVWLPRGDRLGQRLEWVSHDENGEHAMPLWESIDQVPDANAGEDWPASPPLTDWHLEERGSERVIMAVGRAGRSHWSVAITATAALSQHHEAVSGLPAATDAPRTFTPGGGPPHSLRMPGPGETPAPTPQPPRLQFDIACRAAEAPTRIGSRYRILAPCHVIDDAHIELAPGVILSVDRETSRLELDESSATVLIEPASPQLRAWPQTVRWRYEFSGG